MTGTPIAGYPVDGEEVYSDGTDDFSRLRPHLLPMRHRSRNPSPGSTVPTTNGRTGHIDYNLPPGAKIISETDHVQSAAPRPTLAPRRR